VSNNADVAKRLAELEMKTESLELSHNTFSRNTWLQLRQLLDAVRALTTPPDPPKRPVGFITPDDKKDAPKGPAQGAARRQRSPTNPHKFDTSRT
jgi:hypothetical protein